MVQGHGVFTQEIAAAGPNIATDSSEVVGVVAPVDPAATGFAIDDVKLLRDSDDITALGLTAGSDLAKQVDALVAQSTAPIVLHGIDPGIDQAEAAANAAGSAGTYTGVWKLAQAQALVGYKPSIVIAPGFAETTVHTALVGVAKKIKAVTALDGPDTDDAAAITAKDAVSDDEGRALFVDPWPTVSGAAVSPSAFAAGVIAGTKYWESHSNRGIIGIDGTSRPIGFDLTDINSQANALNSEKITTIIREQGFRLWGNRSLAPDGYAMPFLMQRRADDRVQQAIALAHFAQVDQGITRSFADNILTSVNAFLRQETALERIIGGTAYLNPELNTGATLSSGQIYIDYDITYVVPAEEINFRRQVTNTYYNALFGG